MIHPSHRVRRVEVVGPYVLQVTFADAVERRIDLEPILAGEIYGPLRDPQLFSQVRVDPEVHTIVWPNGTDFDPATLHDWPEHAAAFAQKAEEWARRGTNRRFAASSAQLVTVEVAAVVREAAANRG